MANDAEDLLREEFNRWAMAGRGEQMHQDHLRITEKAIPLMGIELTDRILDIGCGSGWISGMLAQIVARGQVVGIDVSDEMVRRARGHCRDLTHVMFIVSGVEEIPWDDDFFHKAFSVESAYYWPDPAKAFREIFRVLRPGGSAWILINLYKENIPTHQWRPLLPPTHLLSGDEWCQLMKQAGFVETGHRRIVDDRPVPKEYHGMWFKDVEELRMFQEEGALLFFGRKP